VSSSPMRTLIAALLAVFSAGCEEPAPTSLAPAPRPLRSAARGGSLVIDAPSGAAWIADSDNRAIHRVDLVSLAVTSTPVDGAPEQIAAAGEGTLAVTLRDKNLVALYAVDAEGAVVPIASADVPCDPFGLAITPQGEILVTSAFCHAVTALEPDTLERRF